MAGYGLAPVEGPLQAQGVFHHLFPSKQCQQKKCLMPRTVISSYPPLLAMGALDTQVMGLAGREGGVGEVKYGMNAALIPSAGGSCSSYQGYIVS
jgi:hypothetical protein